MYTVYFGHLMESHETQQHEKSFNLLQNSEKLWGEKRQERRCRRYLFSWESWPCETPHLQRRSQSLRSDQKRQDMTSSLTPRPEEVLQKRIRVHQGRTCTRWGYILTSYGIDAQILFCFMMNMCQEMEDCKCCLCLCWAAVKGRCRFRVALCAPTFQFRWVSFTAIVWTGLVSETELKHKSKSSHDNVPQGFMLTVVNTVC